MGQGHPEPHRPTVVLHVQCVSREAKSLAEVVDDLGVAVERVRKLLWVGPITVPESGIIRRDEMKRVGEAREERLEHERRRGEFGSEGNCRGVWRGGMPGEDGCAVDS